MGNCANELFAPRPPCGAALSRAERVSAIGEAILQALQGYDFKPQPCEKLKCGAFCGRLDDLLNVELSKCGKEFYTLCDFDRLIRICPFDPAWDAFEWKQQLVSERVESLEVQVKELEAKLPKGK